MVMEMMTGGVGAHRPRQKKRRGDGNARAPITAWGTTGHEEREREGKKE